MEKNQTTILKALEKVYFISEKSNLDLKVFHDVTNEIKQISHYFQIDEIQSILLATFFSLSCFEEVEPSEVITYLGMKKIEFLPYVSQVQFLVDKNILERTTNRNYIREDYVVGKHVVDYIIENKPIPRHLIEIQTKVDSFFEFLSDLDKLSVKKDNEEIRHIYFVNQFRQLLTKNRKYKLVQFVIEKLELIDSFIFFDVIIDAMTFGTNDFHSSLESTVGDYTARESDTFRYITTFLEGKTKLNTLNLIEKDNTQFANKHRIQLTKKALKYLLDMEGISISSGSSVNNKLVYAEKIQKKSLHYNLSEQKQLEPLLKSMPHRSFTDLQKRLQESSMPKGLTALLYGAPGTGKTETVYQLAKKYNRAIFKVEIADTKSMWFGESQKLVKKIFTDYYEYKKQEKICPILLFNEADAVIGKRKNAGSSSTSDTENAIQNILLEELENFDGIMFATSNLIKNIDPAFERRFLFKIQFEVPSTENAAKIWRAKLPILTKKESEFLATKFNFSGGEMENIARKYVMEEVVLGTKVDFSKINSFCENEKWSEKNTSTKIGF
ncbi:ATP-binding protein [Flavobacterium antarcticum]|uniref:ATP-binding protein n=1 Tax=Flavobacterium antarcticum TaxID=271155 RepID=UPI0003B4BC60|nr:ATP-binding protein [Flavobacterium antarcticum]